MTLQQLEYILTIAQCGSMNKASEKLFISQPTLTSVLKEVEKEFGITIFTRTSKGVILTNEGNEFLLYAKQVMTQYEDLKQRYSDKSKIKRKFSVSCQHYSFAVKAFVDVVKEYDTLKYEFAIKETKTMQVIEDVGYGKSEIGILFLSESNQKFIQKLFDEYDLKFTHLVDCDAYVYLYKDHPLAKNKFITLEQLIDYPYLSFDQGDNSNFYLAEEILTENEYQRIIKASDRATMLNLMRGLNGYILCSGIICEELNGDDYIVVPYKGSKSNPNSVQHIGYIIKNQSVLTRIGARYIQQLKRYLNIA